MRAPELPPWTRALAPLLVFAAVLGLWRFSLRAGDTVQLYGVRLGLTPAQLRARFEAPGPGSFRTVPGPELALEWAGASPEPSLRFEFHDGMLVALRARVRSNDPAAQGPPVVVSNAAVLARRGAGTDRTEVTWLARDCPTHADEARRLLTPP